MEHHREEALAAAIQDGKIGHLQYWLTHWQTQVEIDGAPTWQAATTPPSPWCTVRVIGKTRHSARP